MTVQELIEELSLFPEDYEVVDPTYSSIDTVMESTSANYEQVVMLV